MPFSLQTLTKKRALARTKREARKGFEGKAGKQRGPKPCLFTFTVCVRCLH